MASWEDRFGIGDGVGDGVHRQWMPNLSYHPRPRPGGGWRISHGKRLLQRAVRGREDMGDLQIGLLDETGPAG